MSFLACALQLAELGFHVFPCVPNSKLPAIEDFPHRASRDPATIRSWWMDPVLELEQPYNIGISTTRFGDSEALIVVDIDNKEGKNGNAEFAKLESEGQTFCPTFEQSTPTGGRHLFYRTPKPVTQGAGVLATSIDIRSRGGYVVGAGSRLDAGEYSATHRPLAESSEWLIQRCGSSDVRDRDRSGSGNATRRAESRAVHFLTHEAQLAKEGEGGNHTTFKVAATLKDLGVDSLQALDLMADHWNLRCEPPWSIEELKTIVKNAYAYGERKKGSDDPANVFPPLPTTVEVLHPFDEMNREYAYIVLGGKGHILQETTDFSERVAIDVLNVNTFHEKLGAQTMMIGNRVVAVTKEWIKSARRRTYDGMCFSPERKHNPRFYNLWRGFAVTPLSESEEVLPRWKEALDAFLEHAEQNVCGGDKKLTHYLLSYFAHLVQRPHEKPLVALVFRGRKGVGKNALIERVGFLVGSSFAVVANRRYLTGNFNSILENKLLLVLDEAFWSGDKEAEGILKDLITGAKHKIERKGKEPYEVENCLRLAILGNEDWLVPASEDERRYAVFDVGDGRKRDIKFFKEMREGMEAGGYRLLLSFLMNYDRKGVDVGEAPATRGLLAQKELSASPFDQWWKSCLNEGRIISSDFGGEWPLTVNKDRFRDAFIRYCQRERNIGSRVPTQEQLGKMLKQRLPSVTISRTREEGARVYVYNLPNLEMARESLEKYMGQKIEWETPTDDEEAILS